MSRQVSILDGEVNRNWYLTDRAGERHLLTLFHDTVTGARAAMLDYEEVPGSPGTTNVFNLVAGQVDISFSMKNTGESGRLSIVRKGLTGFAYECELNGRSILDTTSTVQNSEYEYQVVIPATLDVGSRVSGVTWYEVHASRKADGMGTVVHRRFRDFFALHEQVESLMKGHHLWSSLPHFPGKKSKLWTNHGDESFVEDRRVSLEQYMRILLQLPHVSTLDSTRAFLGMVGNLREFSVVWEQKELGAVLKCAADVAGGRIGGGSGASAAGGDGVIGPPVVFSVLGNGKSPSNVSPGDRLSKVNGESTDLMTLQAARSAISRASRPVMLHFLSPILRMDSVIMPLPDAFLRCRDSETNRQLISNVADDGGPPLAAALLGPGPYAAGDRPDGETSASALGGWSLRGIPPMRWPARRRAAAASEESVASGADDAAAVASAGKQIAVEVQRQSVGSASNSYEPGRHVPNNGKARLGRPVGPFGDGTGAAGSGRPLASSGLFGHTEQESTSAGLDGTTGRRGIRPQLECWRQIGVESEKISGERMPTLTVEPRRRRGPPSIPPPDRVGDTTSLVFGAHDHVIDHVVGAGRPVEPSVAVVVHHPTGTSSTKTPSRRMNWPAEQEQKVPGHTVPVLTALGTIERAIEREAGKDTTSNWMRADGKYSAVVGVSSGAFGGGFLSGTSGIGSVGATERVVGQNGGVGDMSAQVVGNESSDEEAEENPFA